VSRREAWTVEEADECSGEVVALVPMSREPRAWGGAEVGVAVRRVAVVDVVAGVEEAAHEAACA